MTLATIQLAALILMTAACATTPAAAPTVDVTGAWRGRAQSSSTLAFDMVLQLQQDGARVTGELRSAMGSRSGALEGTVSENYFSWRLLNGRSGGEMTVNGDDMTGYSTSYGERYNFHRQ